jgi:hypothetical protein
MARCSPLPDVAARRAFETVFRAMVSVLERSMTGKNGASRSTAQAIAALSIGGMVVARTSVDRAHADELRASCIAAALELGVWDNDSECSARKSRSKSRVGVARAQVLVAECRRLEEAEPLMWRALAVDEKCYGSG